MIAIITAIQEEFDSIKKILNINKKRKKANLDIVEGNIKNMPVVLVKSGVGKVNAAYCTQLIIDDYKPTAIINMGVGGALDNALDIGDVVISSDTLQYDMDATAFGYKISEIPDMDESIFNADQTLIKTAENAAQELELNATVGRILTADLGLNDSKLKEILVKRFNGLICDMEGAAIAQVCYQNQVNFLIIRSVSDKADEEATETFSQNKKPSSEIAAELIQVMLNGKN